MLDINLWHLSSVHYCLHCIIMHQTVAEESRWQGSSPGAHVIPILLLPRTLKLQWHLHPFMGGKAVTRDCVECSPLCGKAA
jgi:hypothetical protein